jgi:hypothetical protein
MQSKIHCMKSNAARTPQSYRLTRADLIAVSGGWHFNIPSEAAPQSSTKPTTAAIDGAHVENTGQRRNARQRARHVGRRAP